jgi:hypothetical protein
MDENAHYYYLTESLPHTNLTRVRMGVLEAPLLGSEQSSPVQGTKGGRLVAMQRLSVMSGNLHSLRPLLCGNRHKED